MSRHKLKPGDAVRTNALYSKTISKTPRSGILLRELSDGTWRVSLGGFDKPQTMSAKFLERDDGT